MSVLFMVASPVQFLDQSFDVDVELMSRPNAKSFAALQPSGNLLRVHNMLYPELTFYL